jgi:hypothetical protein
MADIFEMMRQRIKNMEAELDATSTQLKAMAASKQELKSNSILIGKHYRKPTQC